jgi:hypothetical protein
MGFATDNGKSLSIQVNATSGGHVVWPGSRGAATTLALANTSQGAYEFLVLQYDGGGNFRVVDATPATAQAIGTIGAGGITRWSFPSVGAYTATVADNGGVVSSYNSPLAYLAVTLPPTSTISMGWIMAFATDNGKALAVQVNGGAGEKILLPAGGGTSSSSISLATNQNYEYVALQFDGSNYRVVAATPQTLNFLGGLINAGSPASSSPCTTNQMMHDSDFLYICTAPNTWKRAAITG